MTDRLFFLFLSPLLFLFSPFFSLPSASFPSQLSPQFPIPSPRQASTVFSLMTMTEKIFQSHIGPTTVGTQTSSDPGLVALNPLLYTPWTLLHPTKELYTTTVDSAKYFLDFLAVSVSGSQSARLQNNRKRKRSDFKRDITDQTLQMRQLYVEGFTLDQIWEQATRILNSAGHEIQRDSSLSSRRGANLPWEAQTQSARLDNTGFETDHSEHRGSINSIEGSSGQSRVGHSDQPSESMIDSEWETEGGIGDNFDGEDDSKDPEENEQDVYTQDPFGLNDGFFSIDDFNKQSEFFERQDAKGGPDDDIESDEEIDWHTDPLVSGNAMSVLKKDTLRSSHRNGEDSGSESSDEEGPTFDNTNLRNNSDTDNEDSYVDGGDGASWMNTNDIKYSDFFAQPPRKASANKLRPLPKTQPDEETIENEIAHAMADVRRDLFEDDASIEDGVDSDREPDTEVQNSTHEKQRARIADEIRRLEAANVAKKEWMLAGEARAAERPVNSLIEEDLEFERIGKPVPVVTNELTEDIEELVKRRILAKEFDEVIRRRPGATPGGEIMRRGRFELEDTKPQKSLAELYETDHLRATDPNYVDSKDLKLKREHADIASLWKEISSQLDTLSNWHYKPKAPQASINVVADVATVLMEEARPTASGAVSGSEALAPQEIYTPGDDGKVAGELVLKSGVPVSREEMSREEKAKWRRQQKEEQRKSNVRHVKPQSGKTAEKQQLVSDLKHGGVKLIGKQGEVTDIYGREVDGRSDKKGADTLKL